MRLTFTFSREAFAKQLTATNAFQSTFEFPDEALNLSEGEARIHRICNNIAALTNWHLYVSSNALKWKQKRFTLENRESVPEYAYFLEILFSNSTGSRTRNLRLKILNPICDLPLVQDFRSWKTLNHTESIRQTKRYTSQLELMYLNRIDEIVEDCCLLLRTNPRHIVAYMGFHPFKTDKQLIAVAKKYNRAQTRALLYPSKKNEHKEKPKLGHVYFIQQGDTGAIKIGYSTNPKKRLQTLSTASPHPLKIIKVIEGGKNLEKSCPFCSASFER